MPAKTVRLRNTNPVGAVVLPTLGISVDAGGTFEVPPDVAENLLAQTGNYEIADPDAAPAADTAQEG